MAPSTYNLRTMEIPFLEPPHSHDVTSVSHVTALPSTLLFQLPESVQDALWAMQESASVAYASYTRLQELLQERFDRLVPVRTSTSSPMEQCTLHSGQFLGQPR